MKFSKQKIMQHIERKLILLEREFGFDPNNGSDQLKTASQETIIAYGEYEALNVLWDDINNGFELVQL